MIAQKDWKWFGLAAHFICGRWCRFHMATLIGDTLVSTVGQYVHPQHSQNERTEAEWLVEHPDGDEIGYGRFYETMAFKTTGKFCKAEGCECGLPEIVPSEIEMDGYKTVGEATRGHMEMCTRIAESQ